MSLEFGDDFDTRVEIDNSDEEIADYYSSEGQTELVVALARVSRRECRSYAEDMLTLNWLYQEIECVLGDEKLSDQEKLTHVRRLNTKIGEITGRSI